MGCVKCINCEVHQILKNYQPLHVVRIRAEVFKVFGNKRFIVSLKIKVYDRVEVEEIQEVDLKSLYSVHPALSDDSNEGRIWIKPSSYNEDLIKEIRNKRCIVCVKRKTKGAKSVYNEALYADAFYLKKWKERGIEFAGDYNFVFINGWYRRLLGIKGSPPWIIRDLKIKRRRNPYALLYKYPRNHPQTLVLTSSMLGIIGVGLGFLGAAFGFASLCPPIVFIVLVISGCAIILLGVIGLISGR